MHLASTLDVHQFFPIKGKNFLPSSLVPNFVEVLKCCTIFTRPLFLLGVLKGGLGTRLVTKVMATK